MPNNITITGNAGSDFEIRFTPGGAPVGSVNLGDTPRKLDRDRNEWVDAGDTLWLRVNAWHELAEWAAEHVRKGVLMTVTGTLKQRNWEDKDGGKRSSYEVTAKSIAVHPPKQRGGGGGGFAQPAQAPAPDPWATPAQHPDGDPNYSPLPF